MYETFKENVDRYAALTKHEREIQARLELAEKTVCLTRDHLVDTVRQAEGAATPADWQPLLNDVRFVGVRLVDACLTALREKKRLSPEELLINLNAGSYRFRTTSPLREIHAAMLRQRRARKVGNDYVWAAGGETVEMRPRLVTQNTDAFNLDPTGTEEGKNK